MDEVTKQILEILHEHKNSKNVCEFRKVIAYIPKDIPNTYFRIDNLVHAGFVKIHPENPYSIYVLTPEELVRNKCLNTKK